MGTSTDLLLDSTVKIIFKVLTNLLSPILNEMIGEYQIGFIKDCNILNGIMTVHETLHHMKRGKKRGFILELNLEKA